MYFQLPEFIWHIIKDKKRPRNRFGSRGVIFIDYAV